MQETDDQGPQSAGAANSVPLDESATLQAPEQTSVAAQLPHQAAKQRSEQLSEQLSEQADAQPHRHHHLYLNLMGEGAMGQVYLAKDRDLQRKVAIKTLHENVMGNREVLRRFLNEMQITAQLEHPNVVPIYGLVVAADGSIGYSMKVVKGKNLKTLLAETRVFYDQKKRPDPAHSLNMRLHYFLMVCDAMAYAHNKGVIHRDLKPANIMLGTYNEVYVMDWGIARLIEHQEPDHPESTELSKIQLQALAGLEEDLEATQIGQILGTPRYMSPQQAAGKNAELDGKSDQFALGLILFELVTLKPAIQGKQVIEVVKKILKSELEPYQHYAPRVRLPLELLAIIQKATAIKPDDRYPTVFEMANDIRRYLRDEPISARATPPLQKLLRWFNRHRTLSLSGVMSVFLLSATATLSNLYQQQASLLKANQREHQLTQLLNAVGQKSQDIDTQFLNLEQRLEKLAAAARALLNGSRPDSQPFTYHTAFSSKLKQPADLSYSSHYGKMLSLEQPDVLLAPGAEAQQFTPLLSRLQHLRQDFRQLFLTTRSPSSAEPRASQSVQISQVSQDEQQVLKTGSAVSWAYLALKEGVQLSYPGKTGYPLDYDPRRQSWYRLAAGTQGMQWGSPHIDVQGQGLVLSCTTALYDQNNQFRGVAGLDLTFDYMIKNWMAIENLPFIEETYLLNYKGEVIIRSSDRNKKQGLRFGENRLEAVLDTPPFAQQQVLQNIQKQKLGYLEYQENSRNLLLVYYPIKSINWYYVVLVNGDQLFSQADE